VVWPKLTEVGEGTARLTEGAPAVAAVTVTAVAEDIAVLPWLSVTRALKK
jgi:hypothetical protein